LHAKPAARDLALGLELRNDALHRFGWDGKGNAGRAARRREDRGIHADDLARLIECRTAGVAFIHRGVDLDEIVVGAHADIAAASRDDTGRDRTAKAERVADGDHPIAGLHLGMSERHEREWLRSFDLNEREIGAGVGTYDLGWQNVARLGDDLDLDRALNDVIVGNDVAVGGDEKARALALHGRKRASAPLGAMLVLPRCFGALEEALQRRSLKRILVLPGRFAGFLFIVVARGYGGGIGLTADRDHSGGDALDERGEAWQHGLHLLLGLGPVRRCGCETRLEASNAKNGQNSERGNAVS